jgi:hypothetical protein
LNPLVKINAEEVRVAVQFTVNLLNEGGKSISSIGITMRFGVRAIALLKRVNIFPRQCLIG